MNSAILPTLVLLILTGCTPRVAPLPAPMVGAALDVGATFLRAQVDSLRPSQYSEVLLLGTRAESERAPTQAIPRHPTPWLEGTIARLHLQGGCPPPEADCFHGRAGYLFVIGRPSRWVGDSVRLLVTLDAYAPDSSRVHPPGVGVNPSGSGRVPSGWAFATEWVLLLVPDSTGSLRLGKVDYAVASDAL